MNNEWGTPDWLFQELEKEFHFDIDLCAVRNNSKTTVFYLDYLQDKVYMGGVWAYMKLKDVTTYHKCAFMNPPYSNPKPFIEKAWEDSKYCKIVCLVKCDPSTRWWATFWNYNERRSCGASCEGGKIEMLYGEGAWTSGSYWVDCQVCKGNGFVFYSGPKPGCEVRFFPKRIKFDPPARYKIDCKHCNNFHHNENNIGVYCVKCMDGKRKLSGPTFPCALVIMDRRGL